MPLIRNSAGGLLLLLFLASGFAGLIYQSIWSHYLGLTLGHAAFAQTLVLAIFMGGMAGGAWLAGRASARLADLILAYAIIEGLIGVAGLVFHPLFVSYTEFSQSTALPFLAQWGLVAAYQWGSAAALILPQCFLLGATFPLLSAGYLRLTPQQDSRVLGGLYFSNSLGAGFGALVATFLLLPAVGMPGSMLTAGLINVLVALGAWSVSKALASEAAPAAEPLLPTSAGSATHIAAPLGGVAPILLIATALSGAFSFVYEIGWIRMLNQALGSTVHSFELMLAAFIFGLAFGGLWVRRRADKLRQPLLIAAWAQVLMGIAALISVVVFTQSFSWVGWLFSALARSETGYALFSLGSAGIAMLVMFPAAFFAGMTLPLFTVALLRTGNGEGSIGRIYAANTLGAIAGVMLAVHILIPLLGLRLAVTLAAVGDILIGMYLLRRFAPVSRTGDLLAATACLVLAVAFSLQFGAANPRAQASGVFRHGVANLGPSAEVVYLRDGKTATISVFTQDEGRSATIATNGKPDAALATRLEFAPGPDEPTMLMLAALPLTLHPEPREIAAIGWGSGLTTHTVLGSQRPQRVDSIEIEPAMYAGARLFGDRNRRAYEDPRSQVIFGDARSHFASGSRQYDVIISEPSNPWVNGVANLFTQEFYHFLAQQLNDGGLLVQWLQTYEIGDPLVAQMSKALASVFPHVEVYLASTADLIFVASQTPIGELDTSRITEPALRAELHRVGLSNEADYALQRMGDVRLLRAFTQLHSVNAHSDYFPTVSLLAPADRFVGRPSLALQRFAWSGLPITQLLGMATATTGMPAPTLTGSVPSVAATAICQQVIASLRSGVVDPQLPTDIAAALYRLLAQSPPPLQQDELTAWSSALATIAASTLGYGDLATLAEIWQRPDWLAASPPPAAEDALEAYAAAAVQDPVTLRAAALAVLEQHSAHLAPQLNEQMLVLAMVTMAEQRDFLAARALETRYGVSGISTGRFSPQRALLLAWAEARP